MLHWWRPDRKPVASREEQRPQLIAHDADAKDDRRQAVQSYKRVVEDLTAMLYCEDPIGIGSGPNDEYEPEAEAIAIWLLRAEKPDLAFVRRQVHEDFVECSVQTLPESQHDTTPLLRP